MKVLKFGGSSVANAENIKKVVRIVHDASKKRERIVVVVSALGGITDRLIELANLASKGGTKYQPLLAGIVSDHNRAIKALVSTRKRKKVFAEVKAMIKELDTALHGIALLRDVSARSLDLVVSFGEQLSARIVCEALADRGLNPTYVDARTLIKTDENFGSASVLIELSYELISKHFQNGQKLSVMGGFIASTVDGTTSTLGRGGSDYTASLAGAALGASVIEIWTDVDGIMTADPRKVWNAFPIKTVSYEEAGELAHFGAKVVHPKTMKPARLKGIPIHIRNTFNPEGEGTTISDEHLNDNFFTKGISSLAKVSLMRIQSNNGKSISEILAQVFDVLARCNVDILLITQASHEQSVSIAVSDTQARETKRALEKSFALEMKARQMLPISIKDGLSIIALVGTQMKGVPGISGKLFSTLGDNKINIVAIAQGSSELNISVVVSSKDEMRSLKKIHEAFFGPHSGIVNLFLVGTGVVGSALLKQLEQQSSFVRLCGIADHRSMIVDVQGISPKTWKKRLSQGAPTDLRGFVDQMVKLDLPTTVFADCTANEEIVTLYESIFNAGVAVITPNKRANSGTFARYQHLKDLAQKNGVPFVYETNVGAGLPIIRSVQSLIRGGDEIRRVEAVLSGTLSYIFNEFSEGTGTFSEVLRNAMKKGYTEPDPRDDLTGADVGRKILILAREIGLPMEPRHVKVNSLLPKEAFKARSVDDFLTGLKKFDAIFEKKRKMAKTKNHVLRYIATIRNGKADVSLREVDQNHPAYHLSGNDNIISVTTKRYNQTPLVIKGPGAGADVTAGGILAAIRGIGR